MSCIITVQFQPRQLSRFFDILHVIHQSIKGSSPFTTGPHGDKQTSALAHSNSSELLDLVGEPTTCCGINCSSLLSLCSRWRQAVVWRVQHLLCRRGPHHWGTPGALLLHWWPAKQVSWNIFHYFFSLMPNSVALGNTYLKRRERNALHLQMFLFSRPSM